MNPYPNLSLTLLLVFILLPPFVLNTLYGGLLEPYPAIILPSGSPKADVGLREISFNRTSIWGKQKKDNTWTRVDLETFLAPIPVHYLYAITKNSLGLKSAEGRVIKLEGRFSKLPKEIKILSKLPKEIKILSKKVTPSEVKNGKHWWRQKLSQSGYASDELMIISEQVKFDIETGKIIGIKRSNEEIIRLD